jgi:hypothetical protein
MSASGIVEAVDVIKDYELSLFSGLRNGVGKTFGFESGPKGFLVSVVITVAFTTYAGGEAAFKKKFLKFSAGVLAVPIGMMQ